MAAQSSAMRFHFFNLVSQVWHSFLAGQGTTGLGFFSPILVTALSGTVAAAIILALRGKAAVVANWKQNVAIVFVAAVVGNLLWYGPILGWDVIKTVYDDHKSLVEANLTLKAENVKLRKMSLPTPEPLIPKIPKIKPEIVHNQSQAPCELVARPASEIVSRLYVRGLTPPVGSSVTLKPFIQELFYDWSLSLEATCAATAITVSVSFPTSFKDRVRTVPEGMVVSDPEPKWLSHFNEPSRKPDYYLRTAHLNDLAKNAKASITFRHPILLPGKQNVLPETDLTRDFKVTAKSVKVNETPYNSHEQALRLINQMGTLGAWKYSGPDQPAVPIRRDPDMPWPPLVKGEAETTVEVRCTDSPCVNLVMSNQETRHE
jgi:hypothetical protein